MSPKVGGKHIYETFYHQPSYAQEHEDIRLVPPILACTHWRDKYDEPPETASASSREEPLTGVLP